MKQNNRTMHAKTKRNKINIKSIISILAIIALISTIFSTIASGLVYAASANIFEDGFESGNFSSWTRTESSGGETGITTNKYSGNYGAEYIISNNQGYRSAKTVKTINPMSEIYARGYINIDTNGIRNSDDKMYFICLKAGNDNVLFAGWRLSGSNLRWQILMRDGNSYTSEYSNIEPNTKEWYCIEVYWKNSGQDGQGSLWVNGDKIISITNKDTNNFGDVTNVNFGLAEVYQLDYTRVYGDNVAIADQYIGNYQQQTTTNPTNTSPESTPTNTVSSSYDFESGSFNDWTGTETSSGETVTINTYNPYEGRDHARFYANGRSETETAYLYKNVDTNTAYTKGYFNIVRGLPLNDQDDRFYLIDFVADGQFVAGLGIRKDNNQMKWTAYARDGSNWVFPTYASEPRIEDNQYYQIELSWQKDSQNGQVNVYINNNKIFEINNINTNNYGNVDSIRMGIVETTSVRKSMIVYGDNFEIRTGTTSNNNEEPNTQPTNTTPYTPPSSTPSSTSYSTPKVYAGISGYVTSTSQIDQVIKVMKENNLNTFRMGFRPAYEGRSSHSYQANYVQYFLDHCDYTIIVDINHLYPSTESSAKTARNNWQTITNSIFEVLRTWRNNPRVMIELINEYVSSDFYPRMQDLVNQIRSSGYTNPIVINKWTQYWTKINDPLDNTYQGYHYYFNSWSVSGARSQMETALSKGIKIINTEVGADYNEYRNYDSSEVRELNEFLAWCSNKGIGNAVWVNENLMNWPRYQQLGLSFP